jgi:hypothetical protein
MRKVYEQVRPATLEELDLAISTAHDRMVEYRANNEPALAEQCERAMNRYLDARAERGPAPEPRR